MTTIPDQQDSLASAAPIWRHLHAAMRAAWGGLLLLVIVGSFVPASTMLIRVVDSLQLEDQVIHLSAYLLLSLLPALHERPTLALRMAVFAVAVGFAIECGQLFVADRTFQWADGAANAAGAALGASAGRTLRRFVNRAAARRFGSLA